MTAEPVLHWRGVFASTEVNALHAEGFGHPLLADDWWTQVNAHSLGWVTARAKGALAGFANVAWDGGVHAFLLDVLVSGPFRRRGLGSRIVAAAGAGARAGGCEWLHVDFEAPLTGFYIEACAFRPTPAGLIALASER